MRCRKWKKDKLKTKRWITLSQGWVKEDTLETSCNQIWYPFTSGHSFHLKNDVSFQRRYNPKLVPADSWYMKHQTSLQLATELLATLPKVPKLPLWWALYWHSLEILNGHGAGSQQGSTRGREACCSASRPALTLREHSEVLLHS